MTLAPLDEELLLALRQGQHFKDNPGNPKTMCSKDGREVDAASRRLMATGFAARVIDSERPNLILLRITDAGIGKADILLERRRVALERARTPTLRDRVVKLPIGKGVWDVLKIGLGAVLGVVAAKYIGK